MAPHVRFRCWLLQGVTGSAPAEVALSMQLCGRVISRVGQWRKQCKSQASDAESNQALLMFGYSASIQQAATRNPFVIVETSLQQFLNGRLPVILGQPLVTQDVFALGEKSVPYLLPLGAFQVQVFQPAVLPATSEEAQFAASLGSAPLLQKLLGRTVSSYVSGGSAFLYRFRQALAGSVRSSPLSSSLSVVNPSRIAGDSSVKCVKSPRPRRMRMGFRA